jgi:hypothetical protein
MIQCYVDDDVTTSLLMYMIHSGFSFPVTHLDDLRPPFVEKQRNVPYGHGQEAMMMRKELGDFDYLRSAAYSAIVAQFGSTLRLMELKGIICAIQVWWKLKHGTELPKLSRNTKRSFPLMVKYVNDHYNEITPVLPHVSVRNANNQQIPLLDAVEEQKRLLIQE